MYLLGDQTMVGSPGSCANQMLSKNWSVGLNRVNPIAKVPFAETHTRFGSLANNFEPKLMFGSEAKPTWTELTKNKQKNENERQK